MKYQTYILKWGRKLELYAWIGAILLSAISPGFFGIMLIADIYINIAITNAKIMYQQEQINAILARYCTPNTDLTL